VKSSSIRETRLCIDAGFPSHVGRGSAHKSKHTSHGRKTSQQHYVMFVRWFVGSHFRAMMSSFFQFTSRAVVRQHSPSI
jgi:hypothetical protein